jgi:hypothetical protein
LAGLPSAKGSHAKGIDNGEDKKHKNSSFLALIYNIVDSFSILSYFTVKAVNIAALWIAMVSMPIRIRSFILSADLHPPNPDHTQPLHILDNKTFF